MRRHATVFGSMEVLDTAPSLFVGEQHSVSGLHADGTPGSQQAMPMVTLSPMASSLSPTAIKAAARLARKASDTRLLVANRRESFGLSRVQ